MVGTVLILGIVVIAATITGGLVLAGFSEQTARNGSLVRLDAELTAETVTLVHEGGAGLSLDRVEVILRGPDDTVRYRLDESAIEGDGNDRFDPGERSTRAHGFSAGETVEIVVVDEAANSVVLDVEERVSDADLSV